MEIFQPMSALGYGVAKQQENRRFVWHSLIPNNTVEIWLEWATLVHPALATELLTASSDQSHLQFGPSIHQHQTCPPGYGQTHKEGS